MATKVNPEAKLEVTRILFRALSDPASSDTVGELAEHILQTVTAIEREELAGKIRRITNNYPAVLRNVYGRALEDAARVVEGGE